MADSKVCTKCKISKNKSEFSVTKRNEDGSPICFCSWCKLCKNLHEIAKRGGRVRPIPLVNSDSKECLKCHIILKVSEFLPSKRGRLGVSSYCRKCKYNERQRNPDYKEKCRTSSKNYRIRHRERYLAAHRIHQFNRRNSVKVQSDGTVTEEFVKNVYDSEICYWCKNNISRENRTLEHIVELSQGGLHSVSNITMACHSCNSSRKNRNNENLRKNN